MQKFILFRGDIMLATKFEGFFIPGSRTDICDLCLEKAKIKKILAMRNPEWIGKFEGKPVHHFSNEICICKDCLEEEINKYNETHKGE